MATKLQEDFINSQLLPGNIFEFGAGNCAWANSKYPVCIDTIDLYPSPDGMLSNIKYTQGNFLDISIDQPYTNIVCLSSLEHAGIETYHFSTGSVDLTELQRVCNKLTNILEANGRLIITCPAGINEIYTVKDGKCHLFDGTLNFDWGFCTFTQYSLLELFPKLRLVSSKAYMRKSKDHNFFQDESWIEINSTSISNRYEEQNGLLCISLEHL